ncbi:MAG: hypothetical protein GKR97_05360 [Rhizobiaceae bacterium]|nr:hypothetical protein [Rhizobiaceae bacterium]
MNSFKKWYLSRTIWGSIVALIAATASAFDIEIDDATQTAFIDVVLQLVAVGGSMVAVVGRISATSMID